jgi:hypothetical protein
MITSSPGPIVAIRALWIDCLAPFGDDDLLGLGGQAHVLRVVVGDRLAELGHAGAGV